MHNKHLHIILLAMLGALTASGVMSCSGGTPGAWSDIDINGWRYGGLFAFFVEGNNLEYAFGVQGCEVGGH